MIQSPLIKNGATRFIRSHSVEYLIKRYEKELHIDISPFFKDYVEIKIYECVKSNYRFYYPLDIYGDGRFYQQLQEYDWYYMPWKWEHENTLTLLSGNENILEVGSGGLGFIEQLHKKGFNITGLELNEDSIKLAKAKKLNILQQYVQDHAKTNANTYDVCCSYQVLEHIADVHSFIEAQIHCLKSGGRLIVSVPNNNTFLRYGGGGILNFPPHHMGLWGSKSLKNLTRIFDLKIEKVFYEPLQEYHLDWYFDTILQHKIKSNRWLFYIYRKLKLKNILKCSIKLFRKHIKGHTIMIVYRKK